MISSGKRHTILIHGGTVVGYGYNGNGEIAQKVNNNRIAPSIIDFFQEKTTLYVCAGNECTFAICVSETDEYPTLVVFGKNFAGKLGLRGITISTPTPVDAFIGKPVQQVAAGMNHTLVLCGDEVYSFGDGEEGQLGHGDSITCPTPKKIQYFIGRKVIQIFAGGHHSFVLCDDGLYSFGYCNAGQLGHGDTQKVMVPKLVGFFKDHKVKKVACGRLHTLVLTYDNQLYSFGDGGKLGLGHERSQYIPSQVIFDVDCIILDISTSHDHNLILTNVGLFSFGVGSNGELGYPCEQQLKPALIPYFEGKSIKHISAGQEYSTVLLEDGSVMAFGSNQVGQLGSQDKSSRFQPCLVPMPVIKVSERQFDKNDKKEIAHPTPTKPEVAKIQNFDILTNEGSTNQKNEITPRTLSSSWITPSNLTPAPPVTARGPEGMNPVRCPPKMKYTTKLAATETNSKWRINLSDGPHSSRHKETPPLVVPTPRGSNSARLPDSSTHRSSNYAVTSAISSKGYKSSFPLAVSHRVAFEESAK